MRHNGQRCVIGQARKHEERQVKPSHGSLCANTMSGLDKSIPFGFASFVVQRSSSSLRLVCAMGNLMLIGNKQEAHHRDEPANTAKTEDLLP